MVSVLPLLHAAGLNESSTRVPALGVSLMIIGYQVDISHPDVTLMERLMFLSICNDFEQRH